jgi:hypothetical protein
MSYYLHSTTSYLSCICQRTCCCRAWWEDRTVGRLPDTTREQVCTTLPYCYFVILKQEHLWKHATWCQWRLLLSLDVMSCSSLDRRSVSEEWTASLGVTVTEGGKWPIVRPQREVLWVVDVMALEASKSFFHQRGCMAGRAFTLRCSQSDDLLQKLLINTIPTMSW